MVPGHWERIEEIGEYVPAEALLDLGWSPEQLLAAFAARKLHAFGGKEAGLLLPRHEFADQFFQLDFATIQQRVPLLPRVIAEREKFRPVSEVARELKVPIKPVTQWADAYRIFWRLRNYRQTPERRYLLVLVDEVRAMRDAQVHSARDSEVTALKEAERLARRARRNAGTTRDTTSTTDRE